MSDDQLFRTALAASFMLLAPFGIYHRLKSQRTREKLDRRQEGMLILVTLRPLGAASIAGLAAYVIDPRWMAWSSMALPDWIRWAGVGLVCIAGALLVWTFRALGGNLTDTVVTRREHTLVTTGPYRWVRHPFYVLTGIAILACSLIAANWAPLVTGGAALVLLVVRTRREEERLIARFGDRYREYMRRTGRFVPRRFG